MFITIFGKYSFLTMMLNSMFLSFSDEGIEGGGDPDDGNNSGDNDAGTNDTPTVEQLQEQLKAFDGVDVEKYNALKDIDPDTARQALDIFEKIKDDKDLLSTLNGEGNKKETPEADRIAALEARIAEEDNKKEYDRFMSSTEKALEEAIKEHGIEFVEDGINEKDIIIRNVIEQFKADEEAAQAKGLSKGKLGWDDIPRIVKEQTKSLSDYRKAIMSKGVRKGAVPPMDEGGNHNSSKSKNDKTIMSDAQRRQSLAQEIESIKNAGSF